MKKLAGILVLLSITVFATGCLTRGNAHVWKLSAGADARCHAWEEPHITTSGDPAQIEVGAGFITVKATAGFGDNGTQWASLNLAAGPINVEKTKTD